MCVLFSWRRVRRRQRPLLRPNHQIRLGRVVVDEWRKEHHHRRREAWAPQESRGAEHRRGDQRDEGATRALHESANNGLVRRQAANGEGDTQWTHR